MSVLPLLASNYSLIGSIATGLISSYVIYNQKSDIKNIKSDNDEFINLDKKSIENSINNINEGIIGDTHILSNDIIIIDKDKIVKEENNKNGIVILNDIPKAPEIPKDLFKKYKLNVNVKCRFKNFKEYQRYLNNKNRTELLKQKRKQNRNNYYKNSKKRKQRNK